MDYTDWSKETCIKTLKIASMQATLMLLTMLDLRVECWKNPNNLSFFRNDYSQIRASH